VALICLLWRGEWRWGEGRGGYGRGVERWSGRGGKRWRGYRWSVKGGRMRWFRRWGNHGRRVKRWGSHGRGVKRRGGGRFERWRGYRWGVEKPRGDRSPGNADADHGYTQEQSHEGILGFHTIHRFKHRHSGSYSFWTSRLELFSITAGVGLPGLFASPGSRHVCWPGERVPAWTG
jgi:hypothetical protein